MALDKKLLDQRISPREAERLVAQVYAMARELDRQKLTPVEEKPRTLAEVRDELLNDPVYKTLGVTPEVLDQVISHGDYRVTVGLDLSDLADAVVKAREGNAKLMKRYEKLRMKKAKEIAEVCLKESAQKIPQGKDIFNGAVSISGIEYVFSQASFKFGWDFFADGLSTPFISTPNFYFYGDSPSSSNKGVLEIIGAALKYYCEDHYGSIIYSVFFNQSIKTYKNNQKRDTYALSNNSTFIDYLLRQTFENNNLENRERHLAQEILRDILNLPKAVRLACQQKELQYQNGRAQLEQKITRVQSMNVGE